MAQTFVTVTLFLLSLEAVLSASNYYVAFYDEDTSWIALSHSTQRPDDVLPDKDYRKDHTIWMYTPEDPYQKWVNITGRDQVREKEIVDLILNHKMYCGSGNYIKGFAPPTPLVANMLPDKRYHKYCKKSRKKSKLKKKNVKTQQTNPNWPRPDPRYAQYQNARQASQSIILCS
ncbi:hypothetical protein DdX_20694 [Ditylenchus destructor]|uniref:Secreted protein n=1 Tax=Ditylenchus destructor TaxID=166010 RepID=A0AAD4MG68_9BILA|nr:hypothetical protein DdX_20694 [Ditylenchus destructor]